MMKNKGSTAWDLIMNYDSFYARCDVCGATKTRKWGYYTPLVLVHPWVPGTLPKRKGYRDGQPVETEAQVCHSCYAIAASAIALGDMDSDYTAAKDHGVRMPEGYVHRAATVEEYAMTMNELLGRVMDLNFAGHAGACGYRPDRRQAERDIKALAALYVQRLKLTGCCRDL